MVKRLFGVRRRPSLGNVRFDLAAVPVRRSEIEGVLAHPIRDFDPDFGLTCYRKRVGKKSKELEQRGEVRVGRDKRVSNINEVRSRMGRHAAVLDLRRASDATQRSTI
jgi:hypothetical protein